MVIVIKWIPLQRKTIAKMRSNIEDGLE